MSAASALGTNQQELTWAPQRSGDGALPRAPGMARALTVGQSLAEATSRAP